MFDVGFSEMIVIAVVALIVIGPEKLPKVARTLGMLLGRVQRYVADVKSDIQREMQFEDLQKLQQEVKLSLQRTQSEVKQFGVDVKNDVAALEKEIESSLVVDGTPSAIAEEPKTTQAKITQPDQQQLPLRDSIAVESHAENLTEPEVPALLVAQPTPLADQPESNQAESSKPKSRKPRVSKASANKSIASKPQSS